MDGLKINDLQLYGGNFPIVILTRAYPESNFKHSLTIRYRLAVVSCQWAVGIGQWAVSARHSFSGGGGQSPPGNFAESFVARWPQLQRRRGAVGSRVAERSRSYGGRSAIKPFNHPTIRINRTFDSIKPIQIFV